MVTDSNVEQIQTLRYTREFLRDLLSGETTSDPMRLYTSVCDALGNAKADTLAELDAFKIRLDCGSPEHGS